MYWKDDSRAARHWKPQEEPLRVECTLCPRHCRPRPEQPGFCRVRGNVAGRLHTFNYGRSVQAAEETIETEAVYHYRPGSRILSLGNVGCMMSCGFCHNWETSQVKHLKASSIHTYTPEEVVELAQAHGIEMLSWTYNDPVVWHEFVVDTARLAARQGIRSLYKSAFYIEEEPARELCEVVDVFSLSLKSMSPEFYRKVTSGQLEPVLERIELVHRSGRHLEISQLVVPELNDQEQDARQTARWVLDTLGPDVPLHFVRFHPAFRYTGVPRTPIETLVRARDIAREEGIRHCYLGNVYRPGVSDTTCERCGTLQVARFGLTVRIEGIDGAGRCTGCGATSSIRDPFCGSREVASTRELLAVRRELRFDWTEEVNSLHVVVPAEAVGIRFEVMRVPTGEVAGLDAGSGLHRLILSRSSPQESGIVLRWNTEDTVRFLPVLDRAHFPLFDSVDPAAAGTAY